MDFPSDGRLTELMDRLSEGLIDALIDGLLNWPNPTSAGLLTRRLHLYLSVCLLGTYRYALT